MAMPDIGNAPPPPPDVAGQMKPTTGPGGGGGLDIGALIAGLGGGMPMGGGVDITPKIMEISPYLDQLARQVPAIGPDVDRLNVELKTRMNGLPAALAGLSAGGPPLPPATTPPPAVSAPGMAGPGLPTPAGPVAPDQAAGMGMGGMMPPPMPIMQMGAMDLAMQLETKLPALGKDDPSLMPFIQGFIARMRDEVSKVVAGGTEAVAPPPQTAPTDSMLSKIPVNY